MHKPYLLTFAVLLLPIYGHGNIEKPINLESQLFGEQVADFSISKDEIVSAFNARKMRWDLIPFKDLKNGQEFIWKGQFYLTDKKTNEIFINSKINLDQLDDASLTFDPKTKFINPKYNSIVYVLGKNKRHSLLHKVRHNEAFCFQGKVFKQISKQNNKIQYQFTGNTISKVEETYVRTSDNIAELQINESDEKVIGTLDHPFFILNRNSYVQMRNLSVNDKLISSNGNISTVKSINNSELGKNRVFNLKIKDLHNYYVHLNGYFDRNILVHNADYPKPRRLHPDSSLKRSSLDHWRKQRTEDIIDSMKPGAREPLQIEPSGLIMNGNHRVKVLEERGYDMQNLWNLDSSSTNAEKLAKQKLEELFKNLK